MKKTEKSTTTRVTKMFTVALIACAASLIFQRPLTREIGEAGAIAVLVLCAICLFLAFIAASRGGSITLLLSRLYEKVKASEEEEPPKGQQEEEMVERITQAVLERVAQAETSSKSKPKPKARAKAVAEPAATPKEESKPKPKARAKAVAEPAATPEEVSEPKPKATTPRRRRATNSSTQK